MGCSPLGHATRTNSATESTEHGTQSIKGSLRPFGKVGQGAMLDFAALAEGFAKERAWRRVAVADDFYEHGYYIQAKPKLINVNQ